MTIQAQILDLIKRLRQELGMAIILITHDLGVVAGMADRINVMYAGYIVETAPADELFAQPAPPVHARAAEARSRAWTSRARRSWSRSRACRPT